MFTEKPNKDQPMRKFIAISAIKNTLVGQKPVGSKTPREATILLKSKTRTAIEAAKINTRRVKLFRVETLVT